MLKSFEDTAYSVPWYDLHGAALSPNTWIGTDRLLCLHVQKLSHLMLLHCKSILPELQYASQGSDSVSGMQMCVRV